MMSKISANLWLVYNPLCFTFTTQPFSYSGIQQALTAFCPAPAPLTISLPSDNQTVQLCVTASGLWVLGWNETQPVADDYGQRDLDRKRIVERNMVWALPSAVDIIMVLQPGKQSSDFQSQKWCFWDSYAEHKKGSFQPPSWSVWQIYKNSKYQNRSGERR